VDQAFWRRGRAGDAAAIAALTRAAYAKWVPVIGREPKPMTADYDEALRHHCFDMLFLSGQPVALIETVVEADHLLIENIAVSPSHQGQGLGRRLVVRAEERAAALGLVEVRLYTNKLFVENLRFYARLGYQVYSEVAFMGGFAVHMRKPIQAIEANP